MGLNQSKNQNSDDKWNQIATDDMSSTVPHINTLDVQAKNLMNKLQLEPKLNESESPDTLSNIFKGPDETLNNEQNNFSDTSSLFISSDMYNNLLNRSSESKQLGQTGGAKPKKNNKPKKQKQQKQQKEQKIKRFNKSKINSETSESSSSVNKYLNRDSDDNESDNDKDDNESNDESDNNESDDDKDDNDNESDDNESDDNDNESDEFSTVVSGGDLSYLSSSAHEKSDDTQEDADNSDSIPPQQNKVLSSSINTSDINLVSPDTD